MPAPRDVAIVGVHATKQGRNLGRSGLSLELEAFRGALADAGMTHHDVDGWIAFDFPAGNGQGTTSGNVAFQLDRPMRFVHQYSGVPALLYAAAMIRDHVADVIAIPFGAAQVDTEGATASYTRPEFEFTEWTGSTTPAQMALQARRHMAEFGTTREHLAHAAATLRNNAHLNPEAVMFDRGPYTVQDVLDSRLIADPFTLLMCALVNDGGSCVIVTSADRARDCPNAPVWVLAGGIECYYTSYYEPPTLAPLRSRSRMLAAFERVGLRHDDVDFVTTYDHFASGVLMEYEACGFCEVGEGGPFTMENIGLDQRFPVSPDGGNLGYSHNMNPYNFRIIEAVRQLRNDAPDRCPDSAKGMHTYDRSMCRKIRDPRIAVACGPMTGTFSMALLAKN
ncbi:MAG TPA: thiolase family protein [Acidimicrobiales bacterium]|nr:thiolase family protein [Acidimicrobiales bacterium]